MALATHILDLASGDLNDSAKSLTSNVFKVGNLFYSLLARFPNKEESEIVVATIGLLDFVKDRVNEVEDGKIKYDNGVNSFKPNRMPLFWNRMKAVLVESLEFCEEEIEYYESGEAMYR